MSSTTLLFNSPKPPFLPSKTPRFPLVSKTRKASFNRCLERQKWVTTTALLGTMAVVGPAMAVEPSNALSLPTWAVHVSSVAEWITAMALVWQYGQKPGNESWKGLSWGMVPLLGGAMCACTWHFFYNAESLEVLVALQAALTVLGNITMCIAAFRIYSSQSRSESS